MLPETGLHIALSIWRSGLNDSVRATAEAVLGGDLPCFVLGRNSTSAFIAKYLPLLALSTTLRQ